MRMTSSPRRLRLAEIAVAAAMCGCAGGIRDLRFVPTRSAQPILTKAADGTFPHAAWGPPTLSPMVNVDLKQQSVDAVYSLIPAPEALPSALLKTEVLVFIQDPRASFDNLSSIQNDPSAWDASIGVCQRPDVVALQYPQASLAGLGTAPAIATLSPFFFWGKCQLPDASMSVQASVIHDRGYCDAPVKIQDILDEIQNQQWAEYFPKVVENGCADAERPWSFLTSYISENSILDPDLLPKGGFLFNSYLKADIHIPFVQDANIRFNYQYEFALSDGLLAVNSFRNSLDISGHVPDCARDSLIDGLETRLPNAITNRALEKQVLDLPFNGDCQPLSSDDASVPINSSVCALPIKVLIDGIDKVAANGTLARYGLDPVAASNELKATVLDSRNGRYTNWRCAKHTTERGDHNRCDFVLRAKRVNVLPDEVDLVWFDNFHETSYSGLAAYMYLQSSTDTGTFTDKLCVPRANPPARTFAASISKNLTAPAGGQSCILSLFDDAFNELAKNSWLQWVGGNGF